MKNKNQFDLVGNKGIASLEVYSDNYIDDSNGDKTPTIKFDNKWV